MWRAATMTWVDILLNRGSIAEVISLLADSQIFELQPATDGEGCVVSELHRTRLHHLQADIRNYQSYLPEEKDAGSEIDQPPVSLDQALPLMERAINRWIEHIHPLTEQIKSLEAQLLEWRFLARCLEHIPDQSLSLDSFAGTVQHKPFIGTGTAEGLSALQAEGIVLLQSYSLPVKEHDPNGPDTVFVGIISRKDSAALERSLRAAGAQFAKIPAELSGAPLQAVQWLQQKIDTRQARLSTLKNQLDQQSSADQIALWNKHLQRWLWLSGVMEQVWCDAHFIQICGWVPKAKLEQLENTLRESGSPYLLRRSNADEHGEPPVLLENYAWVKPFESFVRGFGVPRANEIDPTPLLAVTTPLMFGFMFGDVGQGAVLVLLGYLLRHRMPILGLLIPAGIVSIFFGFMHGTIFCNEELFEPLWLHPLDHPLTVMGVALLFGAFMLLASLVLAGVQAYWERHTATWVATQLPLFALGIALPALFWNTMLSGVLLVSALLISITCALRQAGPTGIIPALLKLLEDGMQFAINMLSFIRLGAFTLAHCGLSTAVMVLTAIPDSIVAQLLIFVLGNILIIALEGLVVSIQTTRLVMFEFFRRFMEGAGRPFDPLSNPAMNPD